MIEVTPGVAIADWELTFTTARSGGPGGQNVNKVETKVTLHFDVAASPSLPPEARGRIREKLASRIGRDGVLRVTSQKHRTQGANREAAVARFVELVRGALAEEAPRVPTRPSRAARERRVGEKKLRARVKQQRRVPTDDD